MEEDDMGECLFQKCKNPDGTTNGVKLLSMLSKILNPGAGAGVSEAEVLRMWNEKRDK